MTMIKEYKEVHQKGVLTIEKDVPKLMKDCDLGIQIAKDGRVWVCIDGETFLRFRPTKTRMKERRILR